MDEQQWYMAFVQVCNMHEKMAPELETVITRYAEGLSPEDTFDAVFPPTALAAPLPEAAQEEEATDFSDVSYISDGQLAMIEFAEALEVPRVTESMVLEKIIKKTFTRMPSQRTLICEITMQNGFTFRGESSTVADGASDIELARSRSLLKAVQAAWPFEAYLLREQLYNEKLAATGVLLN